MLRLIRYNPTGQAKEPKVYDLEQNPSPTIMAGGVAGDNRSHYWIEDDGKQMTIPQTEDKPPYRVPSMTEIDAIPWNGYNVVSTFTGAGGSCLGYRMAGFRVLWASEFIPAAAEVYRLNHPGVYLDTRDIRSVQPEEILKQIGIKRGDLDLLDGSPPCASFSTAGKREAGWGKVKNYSETKQRVDDLFFEYARILDGLQPKVFIAENVSGLVKGKAKGYFKMILQALKDCGYHVKAKLLDAQWLGVPQMRQRVIFQGVRQDLGLEAVYPKPLSYQYSVREALPNITALRLGGVPENWATSQRCASTVAQSDGYRKSNTGYMSAYQVRDSQHERRHWTIAELKRICGFPDDFQLTGSYGQQWERLGRAVPPVMMKHIASAVRDGVLRKL